MTPPRRSPTASFIEAGIPAGGLFTGAEGIKTAEEASVFGGTAGAQYDACYHLGCDGLGNLSNLALEQMADAAAHATITLAQANQRAGGPRTQAKFDVGAFPKPKGPEVVGAVSPDGAGDRRSPAPPGPTSR